MEEKASRPIKSKLVLALSIIGLIVVILALPITVLLISGPILLGGRLPSELIGPLTLVLSTVGRISLYMHALALSFGVTAIIVAFFKKATKTTPFIAVALILISFGITFAGKASSATSLTASGADLQQLQAMLRGVSNVTTATTPLMKAAEAGRTEEVKALLRDGADPYVKSGFLTAGGLAVKNGHIETVEAFLEEDAVANDKGYLGELLLVAATENQLDIAGMLLDNGAETGKTDVMGMPPLMHAVDMQNWQMADLLLESGADVNFKNRMGWNVLTMAVLDENAQMVEKFLDYGADINVRSAEGWTPLMAACNVGNTQIAELLISRGADMNIRDKNGHTAMGWAAHKGHIDVVRALQSAGARE
ncbi:MAG: hypothetical protein C4520_15990 [Candidatus Abyssobacteria bacterium SURF_5]|uniref:Uncharacterized protein n=1 Tax=Abyssobacteria bacterium (strain SURF_5) TaxID=2093360 RepID=A0A3A4N8S7_ABYX5|nr:MAG: hypothetical protein C4520_15990 [Candidatus Abyssubacteria bacterium SURF_5]